MKRPIGKRHGGRARPFKTITTPEMRMVDVLVKQGIPRDEAWRRITHPSMRQEDKKP